MPFHLPLTQLGFVCLNVWKKIHGMYIYIYLCISFAAYSLLIVMDCSIDIEQSITSWRTLISILQRPGRCIAQTDHYFQAGEHDTLV